MQLFFSGTVYSINAAPLARITRAMTQLAGARLAVFGVNSADTLSAAGITGPHVVSGFIADRPALLRFMQEQHAYVVCLTWPEETWVGANEMATIFPTKLPEYLAQGRPILVHCPGDYFLARFMREHDCGWVVTERSEDALAAALRDMSTESETRRRRCRNALAAAQIFAGHRVATQFSDELAQRAGIRR